MVPSLFWALCLCPLPRSSYPRVAIGETEAQRGEGTGARSASKPGAEPGIGPRSPAVSQPQAQSPGPPASSC